MQVAAVLPPTPATPQFDDEDAAERMRAPDENFIGLPPAPTWVNAPPEPAVPTINTAAAVPAAAPPPAPSAKPPLPLPKPAQVAIPAIRPSPRPSQPVAVAANAPVSPTSRPPEGEGDVDLPPPQPGRNWTIQIGAYADQGLAKAQLATYADRARDVLASASRFVAPFQSADGRTMYRARFGLFAEDQARDVCNRLTRRGQTCFATIETR